MHGIFLLFFIFLVSCNRPDAYPELRDPIFRDMDADYREAEKHLASLQKDMDTAKAEISNAQPQTGQSKTRWTAFYAIEKKHEKARQMLKYHALRRDSRKQVARNDYQVAFKEGKPWPLPEEYEVYKRDKNLKDAPRDWNVRLKEKLAKDAGEKAPSSSH